ncbi:MAG: type IV pilus assembly protein PilM [Candidatus Falkowbacteria bacterium]|nr:type IV pilus assembly protein PilM [Candidatus Falkowbacteria bacterium]
MGSLFSSDDTYLGIDIGDSSLKMVELKKKGPRLVLVNYGFTENVSGVQFTKLEDPEYLASAINKVRKEAGIKAKKAVVSLPTFSVFSSIINVVNNDRKVLAEAVREEAKKVIPLPLEEMILDWKIIPAADGKESNNLSIFLTGSPKKLVRRYIEIFAKAHLELASLETETFSLIRCLMGDDPSTVMIVEIGSNSTDLVIVKESIPIISRSLEVCSRTITNILAKNMNTTFAKAEQFKLDLSLTLSGSDHGLELPPVIVSAVQPILNEIEYMLDFFATNYKGKIEKIILSGGGAMMFGFSDYLSKKLNMSVYIGDPWARVDYPSELKEIVSEVGPRLAVSIGLAMREI